MDGGVREEDSVPKDNDQDQGAMSDSIHSHRDTPTKGSPAKETLVTSQVNEHYHIYPTTLHNLINFGCNHALTVFGLGLGQCSLKDQIENKMNKEKQNNGG
ncbi:uncharacterized protein LOC111104386 isoform X1 [Crassostrea virginica]